MIVPMTTAIALASLIVSVVVAVTVPLFSYRLTLRQEHIRWLREQRAQVYLDLLTEAYAEQQWEQYTRVDDETKAEFRHYFPDLRLPPQERARLGTRATLFGSSSANKLFNLLGAELFWGRVGQPSVDDATLLRVQVGRISDELQRVTRAEMRTEKLLKNSRSSLLKDPHPPERESRKYFVDLQRREEEMRRRMDSDPEFLKSAGADSNESNRPDSQTSQDED
jgi:hypothetical protein